MRTCQSCGLENPDDRDFCDCGEYLRWDPTGFVQAVTPEMAAQAAADAPAEPPAAEPAQPATPAQPAAAAPPPPAPDAPRVAPATESPFETYAAPPPPIPPQDEPAPTPPPAPEADNGHGLIPTPPPVKAAPPPNAGTGGTLVHGAVPAPPPPPPPSAAPEPPAMASITLRLPDEDAIKDDVLALGVDPGGRERIQALVRNQSGIVDNYELSVRGLPDSWWTIYPNTLYLVPFGTGGTYEQQVEIHLHPPRSPEAEARLWDLELVAQSKAYNTEAAKAPFVLGIQPFEQYDTKVKPERASGRRKVKYQVSVENKANAPVRIGFEGTEPDNECKFGFAPGQVEIAPGQTTQTTMIVRPPKQIWIGRPHERRLEVKTHTGENADLLEAQQAGADEELYDQLGGEGEEGEEGGRADAAKGLLKKAGVRGPQMAKPKLGGGGLSVGPQGVRLREPVMRAPRMRGPRMQQKNIRLDQLKIPSRGGGAPPPITGPLLPTQAVFRQKSWLPWWVAVVLPMLALLALLLFLFLPKNTVVPDVVGQKSAFDAEKKITEAGLLLNPQQKTAVVKDLKKVGFVIEQTPKAGEKAKKGTTQVSVVIGIGNGQIEVPKVVGLDLAGAEKTLRESKLTVGKSSIQPPDPKAKISSQIPAEREVVKEGTPVDIFYTDPAAAKAKKDKEKKGGGAAGGGGGGGAAAKDIIVPAIAGQELEAFAQTISKDKLVPEVVKKFDNTPKGTLFATDPPGGTKVEAGSKVKLLVSAGFPQVAFDDDKDVLLISGANGEKLDPIAKGNQAEKDPTWSFDGTRIAFQSDGQVFLKDPAKPDDAALPITQQGDFFKDLAWAPTGNANVLAMIRVPDKGLRELCLGQITKDGITPACLAGPKDVQMDSSVNWAPDGKSILVFGARIDPATGLGTGAFGMVRFSTKKPFSFDVKDYKRPTRFLSDVSETDKGMIDAAISPDGKQMAVVSNFNAPKQFRLVIAKRNDFLLQNAKDLKVKACKAIWLPDGSELLVVQADDCNNFETGDLVRVNLKDPDKQQQLRLAGDNPSYQPLTIK